MYNIHSLVERLNDTCTNANKKFADDVIFAANLNLDTNFKLKCEKLLEDTDGKYYSAIYEDKLNEQTFAINYGEDKEPLSFVYENENTNCTKEILLGENFTIDEINDVFTDLIENKDSGSSNYLIKEGLFSSRPMSLDDLGGSDSSDSSKKRKTIGVDDDFGFLSVAGRTVGAATKKKKKKSDDDEPTINTVSDLQQGYDAIEEGLEEIINGQSTLLIISGQGGIGKTTNVINILKKKGLKESGAVLDGDFEVITGKITKNILYATLVKNYNKILVFDDCDDVLLQSNANILKPATERNGSRIIAWGNVAAMDVSELNLNSPLIQIQLAQMADNWLKSGEDSKAKLPNKAKFIGGIVIVTNKPIADIVEAVATRATTVIEFGISDDEMFKYIEANMNNAQVMWTNRRTGQPYNAAEGKDKLKREVLDFMKSSAFNLHRKQYNLPLNFRTYINILNKALAAEGTSNPDRWKSSAYLNAV